MVEFGLLTLLASFLVILLVYYFMGVPVAFALGLTTITIMWLPFGPPFTIQTVASRMWSELFSFTLLAIPFFLFAGRIMNEIGMTEDLFDFAEELVGSFPGGLAHVNVVVSIIFSGMSGSAVADAAGLGTVEYKAMADRGYSGKFAVGVTGASSTIGPIIPPSIPLIIYGVFAQVSIGALFIAGVIPGFVMGGLLMLYITIRSIRTGSKLSEARLPNLRAVGRTGLRAAPGIMAPLIIIGGILFGYFTPTEAAVVASLYTILIGVVVYGSITPAGLYRVSKQTFEDTAAITIIIAFASFYAYLIVLSGIPPLIEDFVVELGLGATALMFVLIGVILLLGTFMSALATIVVVVPILAPILPGLGINLIYFGVVMMIALMIGLITPPLGVVLFVLERITPLSLVDVSKGVAPFYIPLVLALVVLILFPDIVTFLPRMYGLGGL